MIEASTIVTLALAAAASALPGVPVARGAFPALSAVPGPSSATSGFDGVQGAGGRADASSTMAPAADPTRATAPAAPPPAFEPPPLVFTDGPCPPGYERVSVDAVDEAGRFTAGVSFCERRGPARPDEAGPRGDHGRPPVP